MLQDINAGYCIGGEEEILLLGSLPGKEHDQRKNAWSFTMIAKTKQGAAKFGKEKENFNTKAFENGI